MPERHDCTNPAGHNYVVSGHVSKCRNSGCGKVQIYNINTKSWNDAKK